MSPADRVALLRTREVEVQVVGYTDEELAERAEAEALAAARALGRMWRKRMARTQRLERLERMGVHVPTPPPSEAESRSIVDALIKTTLAGGFRVVRRATGWMSERPAPTQTDWWANWRGVHDDGHLDDHEPFLLTRVLTRGDS